MQASNRGRRCGIHCGDAAIAQSLEQRLRLFAGVAVTRVNSQAEAEGCDVVFVGVEESASIGNWQVPIVAVGNQLSPQALEEVLSSPVEEYLAYPFVLNPLRECLQRRAVQRPRSGLRLVPAPVAVRGRTDITSVRR